VRESLELLDQTTDLLSNCVVDDVHLSFQTANLVKLIALNLRKSFLRIQAPTGDSREQSRHHTPHGQESAHENGELHQNHQNAPFGYKLDPAREDTLAGIQALPMTDYHNVTYMPPPNYDMYMTGTDPNAHFDVATSQALPNGAPYSSDWFALPLDNIFNSSMSTVDQGFGGIGPTVGDRDMLELITNEHYDRWDGAGNTFTNGYQ
jgi:hypothetical protein